MGWNRRGCRAICLGKQPVDPSGVATGPNRRRELRTGSKEDPMRDFNADLQGRRHDPILFSRLQAEDAMTNCKHGTTLGTLMPVPTFTHCTVAHCTALQLLRRQPHHDCPRRLVVSRASSNEVRRTHARALAGMIPRPELFTSGSLYATDPASRDASVILSAQQADLGLLASRRDKAVPLTLLSRMALPISQYKLCIVPRPAG